MAFKLCSKSRFCGNVNREEKGRPIDMSAAEGRAFCVEVALFLRNKKVRTEVLNIYFYMLRTFSAQNGIRYAIARPVTLSSVPITVRMLKIKGYLRSGEQDSENPAMMKA